MIKSVYGILVTTALVAPSAVWAQDAVQEETGGLEEIVVTAQKREEGLSKVPISIAAVSGEAISKKGDANLEQISSSVPNLRITQTGIANRIAIRGISSGDNKGFEQSAAMFVDGIYYGRDQLVRMPIVDVERIEVLRGPQPTLFGKNAIAGAISIINKKPDDKLGGSLNGSYEFNHDETQLTGVINTPFGEDGGARFVGYYRDMGGYVENTHLKRDEPQIETIFLRGTATFGKGPVEATWKTEYAKFDTLGQGRENYSPRGTFSQVPFYKTLDTNLDWKTANNGFSSNTKVFNTTMNLAIEAGSHTVDLTSAYVNYTAKEVLDVDYTELNILDKTNQNERYDQLSQEVRIASGGEGPLTYIAGGYFQTSKLKAHDEILFGEFPKLLPVPFKLLGDSATIRDFSQTSTLWSGFAQATFAVTEALRVTAGVRYNHETKSGKRNMQIFAGPTNPYPIANIRAVFGAGLKVAEHNINGRISENSTTPMVNVQYDISDRLMAYASYAKGVKAGGFDIRSNSPPTHPSFPGAFIFRPEKADSYEGGFKYKSRNLSFAVNYYNTTYKDLQTSTFDGGIGFNVNNASSAKVQGVEAEGRVALGNYVRFSGSVGYLDFKYSDWKNGQCPFGLASNVSGGYCDYTGQRAQFAPKWTGNVAADYVYPLADNLQIALNVNADFSSSYRAGNILDPYTDQAAYTKLGARLALGTIDDGWEIALVGRNLTNKRIVTTTGQIPLSTTLTNNTGQLTPVFLTGRAISRFRQASSSKNTGGAGLMGSAPFYFYGLGGGI